MSVERALPFRILILEEVSSTNDEVKRALEAGEPEGLVVRALAQVSGYGRQGRSWTSPEGGLYCSLLLRPQTAPRELPTLSLVVGMAVRRALVELAGVAAAETVRIKWPNDVVCEQGKLCGISLEACGGGVCVGIGINVFRPEVDRPVQGRNVPEYMADIMPAPESAPGHFVSLAQAIAALPEREQAARREEVITDIQREVIARILVNYGRWRELGFMPTLGSYEGSSFLTGRAVRIEDAAGTATLEGTATGVDERGRLLVRTADDTVPVASGEAHVMVMP